MIANKKSVLLKLAKTLYAFMFSGWFYRYQNVHRKGAIATMQNNPVPWRLSQSRRICLCVWAQNHHLGTAPAGFKVFHIQAVEGMPIFITLFIFI